jgi:hypothetical protein
MSEELYSDSDTSSESECNLDEEETIDSNTEEVDLSKNNELELSAPNYNEYKTFLTLEAALRD